MKRFVKMRSVFVNENGSLRIGWRLLLCAAAYFAALYGVIWGAAAVFGALFNGWGLTTSNISYAPAWAQWIVTWHSSLVYALAYLASGAAGLLMAKRLLPVGHRAAVKKCGGALVGTAIAAALTAIALAFDCMRMEWPLSEPRLYPSQIAAVALVVLGKLSSEILTKRILFDGVKRKAGAYALSCAVFVLLNADWTQPISVLNTLLLGLVACGLYECGGLAASAGIQTALTVWLSLFFGFPTMSAVQPVYALYHVSEAWLTGGGSGPFAGIWMTACLLAIFAVLFRKNTRNILPKSNKAK